MANEIVPSGAGAVVPTSREGAVAVPTPSADVRIPSAQPTGARTPLSYEAGLEPEDLAVIDYFRSFLRAHGETETDVHRMAALGAEWYVELNEKNAAGLASLDAEQKAATIEDLRHRWGPHYQSHMQAIDRLLDTWLSADDKARLIYARGPDDGAIFNVPAIANLFAAAAHAIEQQRRGAAAGGSVSREARKHEIEEMMRSPRSAYYNGPQADALQREYRELVSEPSGAARAPSTSQVQPSGRDRRIAEIEAVMRNDRRRYNRDNAMQAEYRHLIDQRNQSA
jgi:hypothetical protein